MTDHVYHFGSCEIRIDGEPIAATTGATFTVHPTSITTSWAGANAALYGFAEPHPPRNRHERRMLAAKERRG